MLLSEFERPSKLHYKILAVSWAGWLFGFYDLILITFLLIPIGKELNLSKVELSYALGASLAASAVGGIAFGILSDRYGRKRAFQWTVIIYSIATLLSGMAWSLEALIVSRVIAGFGVGGEWATGQTYVSEVFPPKVRGQYGAFLQSGAPIGLALAAIVGGFVEPKIGWRGCFFLSTLFVFMVIIIRKTLPESDLWLQKTSNQIESKGNFFELLSKEYRRFFLLSLALAVFDMSAYWLTFSWLPTYLNQERQLSITQSSLWIVWTQIGILLGCLTFGFVADKLGRRPAYSIYCVLMALGLLMITVLWNVIAATPASILIFMFFVGFGTGNFGGFGPLFSELFPTKLRSTASGSAFNIARGVQFFSPVIIAFIARNHGLENGISIAAVFALLTGVWIWTLPETKGRKLDVIEVSGSPL